MLKGNAIYLRALDDEDLDLIYGWENNPDVWHLSNTVSPFSKKNIKEYLQQAAMDIYTTKQLRLIICLFDGNLPIGCIDLFDFDPKNLRAGVGILIAPSEMRQKGYAFDALNVLKNFCKEHQNLHQLYCNIESDNHSSIALFEKAGFFKSGIKKEWNRVASAFKDELFYQCLL